MIHLIILLRIKGQYNSRVITESTYDKEGVLEYYGTYKYWKYSDYHWDGSQDEWTHKISRNLDKASRIAELLVGCLRYEMANGILSYTDWITIKISEDRSHSLMAIVVEKERGI